MTVLERQWTVRTTWRLGRAIPRFPAGQATHRARRAEAESKGADNAVAAVTSKSKRKDAAWYGNPASARRLTKVIAAAQAQSAGIIGMTGSRPGVGVSVASRELAGALSSFGTKTLLVDLSKAEIVGSAPEGLAEEPSFLPFATEVRPSLSVVELDPARHLSLTVDELRAALALAVRMGFTVVLDLPPVLQGSGAPDPSVAAAGSVYDLVFLVCLSGEMNQKELGACIETCRVIGLNLGGLILNDWRMLGSGLLES